MGSDIDNEDVYVYMYVCAYYVPTYACVEAFLGR